MEMFTRQQLLEMLQEEFYEEGIEFIDQGTHYACRHDGDIFRLYVETQDQFEIAFHMPGARFAVDFDLTDPESISKAIKFVKDARKEFG